MTIDLTTNALVGVISVCVMLTAVALTSYLRHTVPPEAPPVRPPGTWTTVVHSEPAGRQSVNVHEAVAGYSNPDPICVECDRPSLCGIIQRGTRPCNRPPPKPWGLEPVVERTPPLTHFPGVVMPEPPPPPYTVGEDVVPDQVNWRQTVKQHGTLMAAWCTSKTDPFRSHRFMRAGNRWCSLCDIVDAIGATPGNQCLDTTMQCDTCVAILATKPDGLYPNHLQGSIEKTMCGIPLDRVYHAHAGLGVASDRPVCGDCARERDRRREQITPNPQLS